MVFTNVRNPRSAVPRNSSDDYQKTLVKRGATIGANATIVCGTTLGENCLIGAGAVVTRDVAPNALMAGVPARRIGWACNCGEPLPDNLKCESCGSQYSEANESLALKGDA